jgi:hypothetical protein
MPGTQNEFRTQFSFSGTLSWCGACLLGLLSSSLQDQGHHLEAFVQGTHHLLEAWNGLLAQVKDFYYSVLAQRPSMKMCLWHLYYQVRLLHLARAGQEMRQIQNLLLLTSSAMTLDEETQRTLNREPQASTFSISISEH